MKVEKKMCLEEIIKNTYNDIKRSDYKINSGRPSELIEILKNANYYNILYASFADNLSKEHFIWLIQYKCAYSLLSRLDANSMYPPNITEKTWMNYEKEAHACKDALLDDLRDAVETHIIDTYVIKNIFDANPNDIIVDGGAYTGNTSFIFSKKVGKSGHVYAFEAEPTTYKKLEQNINTLNYKNVTAYPIALTSKKTTLSFSGTGVSAKIDDEGVDVDANSIDNLVKELAIKKVDMIKLDVEGAELSVINGAAETIKSFTPKLAISVYHKQDDMRTLTKAILSINRNYKLYFRANTKDLSNLILFFVPAKVQISRQLIEEENKNKADIDGFVFDYFLDVCNIMQDKKNRLIKKIKVLEKRVPVHKSKNKKK